MRPLASRLLLWLAAAGLAAAQANTTVVVQGSGSKTAADFVRSILKNGSVALAADNSLPFTDVESPQGMPAPTHAVVDLFLLVAKGFMGQARSERLRPGRPWADLYLRAQLTSTS